MNVRRGLIRAWIVISVLWLGICALGYMAASAGDRREYTYYLRCSNAFADLEPNSECPTPFDSSANAQIAKQIENDLKWDAIIAVTAAVGLPLITLGIGYVIAWVLRGFRTS